MQGADFSPMPNLPLQMYRLLALLITGFWVTMWTLLLRTELEPRGAALREVPVEHVLKIFFQHQQPSDLFLNGDGQRIGHLRFHPQIRIDDHIRVLEFSGNAQLRLPGAPRQRLTWHGQAELSPALELSKLRLISALRESTTNQVPETTVTFDMDAVTKEASYEVRSDQQVIDSQSFTMDEEGLRKLMNRAGIDATVLQTFSIPTQGTPPRFTAHRSSLRLKDEKIDTLLVSAEMNGQTLLEFHVSQLGQVLHVKTITGWTLETD
jgi:hypothetical protein